MAHEHVADADVQHWLQSVGVESLYQLEVLTFFHRHPTSVLPASYLARLLGYPMDRVATVLDSLADLRLLNWSSQPRGARAYHVVVSPVPSRSEALERLLSLSDNRSGRLLLGKHFGQLNETIREDLQAAQWKFLEDAATDLERIARFLGRTSETVQ
jgi:DNA-binding MarR family transcriptional regulator